MVRMHARFGAGLLVLGLAWGAAAVPDTLPATTRQIQLVRGDGDRYTWTLAHAPLPEVGDHELLVRVRAVAIQRAELDVARELLAQFKMPDRTRQVIGSDAAGDVVRVGRGVTAFRPGQRVVSLPTTGVPGESLGWSVNGVFADYVVLRDTGAARFPSYLSYAEAAALPASGITAWLALGVPRGWTRAGDIVLLQGTGGVSTFALQFAVALGARPIVTSSSDEKLVRAKALGAEWVVNYRTTPEWGDEVLKITDGRGAHVVVDVGGRATLPQSLKSLAREGNLAVVGGLGGYDGRIPAATLMDKVAVARGIRGPARQDFVQMCAFMTKHRLRPIVDRTYPFEQYQQAYDDLEAGRVFGKLVLLL